MIGSGTWVKLALSKYGRDIRGEWKVDAGSIADEMANEDQP